MEAADETDDVLPAGVVAGELEGALDCFGAGVAVVELVRAGHGSERGEALGDLRHEVVVEVRAGHVDEFGGLLLDCSHHFWMTMPGGVDGDAGGEVEDSLPSTSSMRQATAALYDERVVAGVARRHLRVVAGQ